MAEPKAVGMDRNCRMSLILAGVSVGFHPGWTDFILGCIALFLPDLGFVSFRTRPVILVPAGFFQLAYDYVI